MNPRSTSDNIDLFSQITIYQTRPRKPKECSAKTEFGTNSFTGFAVCGLTRRSLIEVEDPVWIELDEPVCGSQSSG